MTTTDTPTFTQIDVRRADRRTLVALHELQNTLQLERMPEDPPMPLDERLAGWSNTPDFFDVRCWAVWDDGAIIANLWSEHPLTAENRHVLEVNILVHPNHRRRGLGRALLGEAARYAEKAERPLMLFWSSDRVPSGGAFLERIDAERGLETHTNQLVVADVDRALVQSWLARAPERASGFEVGFWDGPYPEAELPAIAQLVMAMNNEPRGTIQVEDWKVTPEMLRQEDVSMVARGTERWVAYVRERATGTYAGFTEVYYNPNRPHLVRQGATAVWPQYRNNGLGRWLKAAMLERVLRERPNVQYIRTGNADTNAPMLKINYELGFKPFSAECNWQAPLEKVQSYLSK
jgi:GNAT superfamily N-acetyltransferase